MGNGMDIALQRLRPEYKYISTLKEDGDRAIFLYERRQDRRRVIVKAACAAQEIELLLNEERLLKRISETAAPCAALFPFVIHSQSIGKCRMLILNYIPGQSMQDYVESELSSPGIDRVMAVKCVCAVLEQLEFLHGLNPPIIHRDIKPQNVVLDEDGQFHLIDLGISKNGRGGRQADTLVMGTSLFAPPEQFGYRGTDERSDIYSVGVLLRYCLTQEWDERSDDEIDGDLRAVIQKATRFDPDQRYQTARDMLNDLRAVATPKDERHERGRLWKRLCAFALPPLAIVVLALCFYFPGIASRRGETVYEFKEPLLEQAVRVYLNQPEGELTLNALKQVTSLHIFGEQIYQDEGEFWFLGDYAFPHDGAMRDSGLWRENGGIESLDDLKALPNLSELCLYRQQISDISALRGTAISGIGLGLNPLTDLSPLSGNDGIVYLNVCCLELSDPEVLLSMKGLMELCIAGTEIRDLAPLAELPITRLNLADTRFEDNGALARFSGLESLTLSKIYYGVPEQLAAAPLKELEVTHTYDFNLRQLEILTGLERLSYATEDDESIADAPLNFPNMRHLDLKGVRLESLNCLSQMRDLRALGIYESECADYGGLEALDKLEVVFVSEAQRQALEQEYPNHAWRLSLAY